MQEDLRTLLLASSGVTDLVGSRVTWGVRPQGSALPAVTMFMVSNVPIYTLNSDSEHRDSRVQIDSIADDYLEALTVSRAVAAALSGYSGTSGATIFQGIFQESANDLSESDAATGQRVFRVSADYTAHHLPQE